MHKEDPFIVGLSGDEPSSSGYPDADDATAARFDRVFNGSPVEDPQPRTQSAPAHSPTYSPAAWQGEIPSGSIASSSGEPFTDFDSAAYKASQMQAQTSDQFFVCAVSADRFVVMPIGAAGTGSPVEEHSSNADDPKLAYRDIPLNQLQLSDFPSSHPIHKCGLKRYKRYMKKDFKFKTAYRAMWPLMTVLAVGIIMYMAPVVVITLLPTDVINNVLTAIPADRFTQFVQYIGLGLAALASGKVLIQRHIRRYMLQPGHAKYEYGIIKRESVKIAYNNISNYETNQSVLGRILNYGDIELASPGTNDAEIKMKSVLAPHLVEAVLEGKIEEARHSRN